MCTCMRRRKLVKPRRGERWERQCLHCLHASWPVTSAGTQARVAVSMPGTQPEAPYAVAACICGHLVQRMFPGAVPGLPAH